MTDCLEQYRVQASAQALMVHFRDGGNSPS